MAKIRGEKTGTQELIRDARYHYAALLADPDTVQLAPAVKTRMETLRQCAVTTQDVDLIRLEKQALCDRAEYLHDNLQRACELEVYGAVGKDRSLPGYRSVYPDGFSALIALSGEEQEHAVTNMLKALVNKQPAIAKSYEKDLAKLAAAATKAEKERHKAEAEVAHVFSAEVLSRGELFRQLRRNEGALLTLFPDDKARIRLYFRSKKRSRSQAKPEPTAPAPTSAPTPATPPAT